MHNVTAGGIDIPTLGFGTWPSVGQECFDIVRQALDVGYRHLDTAAFYNNETEVGAALKASGVRRGDVFLTTKVWKDRLAPADVEASIEESLQKLGTDYVDLFLIHWPNRDIPLDGTMAAMNRALERGQTRAIGVCNFTAASFDLAQSLSKAPLAVDQVEYHPLVTQNRVTAAVRRHGAALTAFCPLARGKVIGNPVLDDIARSRGLDLGQIVLRWLIQQPQVIAIPKSSTPARIASNFDVFGFELSPAEMARIDALRRPDGRVVTVQPDYPWDVE